VARVQTEDRGERGTYYRLKVEVDGKSHRINLGYQLAQNAGRKLEYLVSQLESLRAVGELPEPLLQARVNRDLSDELLRKFAELGLIQQPPPRLRAFCASVINAKEGTVGEHTLYKLRNSAELLVDFLGDVPLGSVTPADAQRYVQHRTKLGRASATIGAEVNHARQLFKQAIKERFVAENPFAYEKVGSQVDRSRQMVIDAGILAKVIESAPAGDWRVFLAIVRWTGCRQSEALVLKWSDILWEEGRIKLPSPKTANQRGSCRVIPLFPELRPYLEEARTQARPDAVYVIEELVSGKQRTGRQGKNLRKPFETIIERAGLSPWPKPFQNLRVTREDELMRQFDSHVVREWIGHTRAVAEKHYLKATDVDFHAAIEGLAIKRGPDSQWSPSGQIVAGNATQGRAPGDKKSRNPRKTRELRRFAGPCSCLQKPLAPPVGLEPTTQRLTAACSTD
jgi:integrase